jgi:hypothetical protein
MLKSSYSPIPLLQPTQHSIPELTSSLQTSMSNQIVRKKSEIVEEFTLKNLPSLTNFNTAQAATKKPNDSSPTSCNRGIGYMKHESTCSVQESDNQSPQLSP